MAKPNKISLTENGVISQDALLAYIDGRLDSASVQELEKLLQEDVFAQEALEGLKNSPNKATIDLSVISINTKLRERTGLKEKKKTIGLEIHWANYAYAAVLFGVLIGCGFLIVTYLGNNDQTLAENKEQNNVEIQDTPIQAPVIVTVQDTTVSTKENEIPVFDSVKMLETTLTDESKIAGGKNEKAKVEIATSPVAVAAKENAAKDKATTGMAEAPKPAEAMTYKLDDASMDVSKKAVAREFKAESRGVNNDAESEKTIDPKKSVNLEDAMTLFNAGDYKKAAGKFDEELKVHPDNADALYFGGVSNYIAGDNGKAEKNFEKLIKKGIYADGSKWYKANVLIRKGKKEEAKNIIRELTNSSGSYKERAIKKYEELMK